MSAKAKPGTKKSVRRPPPAAGKKPTRWRSVRMGCGATVRFDGRVVAGNALGGVPAPRGPAPLAADPLARAEAEGEDMSAQKPEWEEVTDRPPRSPRSGLMDALRQTATTGKALRVPRDRLNYLRGLYAAATRSGLILHWRTDGEFLIAWMEKKP